MRKSEYCKNWWFARTALSRELRALNRINSGYGYRPRKKITGFLRRMFQALTNSRGNVDGDLFMGLSTLVIMLFVFFGVAARFNGAI